MLKFFGHYCLLILYFALFCKGAETTSTSLAPLEEDDSSDDYICDPTREYAYLIRITTPDEVDCSSEEDTSIGKVLEETIRLVFETEAIVYPNSSRTILRHEPEDESEDEAEGGDEKDGDTRRLMQEKEKPTKLAHDVSLDKNYMAKNAVPKATPNNKMLATEKKISYLRRKVQTTIKNDSKKTGLQKDWRKLSRVPPLGQFGKGFEYHGAGRCRGCFRDNQDQRRKLVVVLTALQQWFILKRTLEPILSDNCMAELKTNFGNEIGHCLYNKVVAISAELILVKIAK